MGSCGLSSKLSTSFIMMAKLFIFGFLVIWLFTNVVNSEEEAVRSEVESSEPDDDVDAIVNIETGSDLVTIDSASIPGDILDRKKKRKSKGKAKKGVKKGKSKSKKPKKSNKKKLSKAKGKKPKKSTKGKAKKAASKAKGKGKQSKKPTKGKGKKAASKGKGKKSKGKAKGEGKKRPTKGKGKKPSKGKGKPKPKPAQNTGSCKKPSFCGSSPLNSLCKYSKPASGCKKLTDPKLKQEVLNEHNKFRRMVASGEYSAQSLPKATGTGIPDLEWDEGLACLALAWTEQCDFG